MARISEFVFFRVMNALFFVALLVVAIFFQWQPIGEGTYLEVTQAQANYLSLHPYSNIMWGVLAVWFFLFLLFQFGVFLGKKNADNPDLIKILSPSFITICILQGGWIFAVQTGMSFVAFVLSTTIALLLFSVVLRVGDEIYNRKALFFAQLPLIAYFVWTLFLWGERLAGFALDRPDIFPQMSAMVQAIIVLSVVSLFYLLVMAFVKSLLMGLLFISGLLGILAGMPPDRFGMLGFSGYFITLAIAAFLGFISVIIVVIYRRTKPIFELQQHH